MFSNKLARRPGSVAADNARHLPSMSRFRRIAVPTSGATFSQRSLKTACRLAGEGGELRLIYVIEVPRAFSLAAALPGEEAQGDHALSEGARIVESFGCHAATEIQRGRDLVETLLRAVQLQGVDLMVLGARADNVRGLTLALAREIYDRAPCPVVLDYIGGHIPPLGDVQEGEGGAAMMA